MAYIGNSPANTGNYQILDDVSASFNGVLTSFALTTSSAVLNPVKTGQLQVSINGVMQEPDATGVDGFKVSGSNIVFSSAPASGDTFWGVFLGEAIDIGTPSDDTVDTIHIKDGAITGAKIAAGTVVASDIADGSITAIKVAADVATQAELDTVASASLPKAGGAMTGAITTNSTFDGRDIAADGTQLDANTTAIIAVYTKTESDTLFGATLFPFYKADGSSDTIAVTSGTFPFYRADGTADNIAVS